jgi:hypothetical protein
MVAQSTTFVPFEWAHSTSGVFDQLFIVVA